MAVVTTGFFDGVHIGHRKVIKSLCETARSRGEKSIVVTFWPHPRNILRQDADKLRLLTSLQEKKDMLKELGVDEIVIVDFTREFSRLTAKEFVQNYLIGKFSAKLLVVGYDHRLGRSVEGEKNDILEIADSVGIEAFRVGALTEGEHTISSTVIRNLIETGNIEKANSLLGYNYPLLGVVVSGKKIGRTIGFPTANMQLYEPLKLVPEKGVYAVKVDVEGKRYNGICNIGCRPTVDNSERITIETHILDFDEIIYGLDIRVEFVCRIRDEIKFNTLDDLKAQLEIDKKKAKEILK